MIHDFLCSTTNAAILICTFSASVSVTTISVTGLVVFTAAAFLGVFQSSDVSLIQKDLHAIISFERTLQNALYGSLLTEAIHPCKTDKMFLV